MRCRHVPLWSLGLALFALQACATVDSPQAERRLYRPPGPSLAIPAALPGARAAVLSEVDSARAQDSFRFARFSFDVGEGKRVYAFMEITRLTPNRTYVAKAFWHSPDGRVLGPTVERFTPRDATWYVWFWIDLSPRFNRASGSWRVRLLVDERAVASRDFHLVGGAPTPPPARPVAAGAVLSRAAMVSKVDRARVREAFQNLARTFEVREGNRAYALMELTGLTLNRNYEAKAYWHSPDGRVVGPTVSRFTPTDANWFVWFWIDLSPRHNRASGSWRVRLLVDERLLSTQYFDVAGPGGPPRPAGPFLVRADMVSQVDRARLREAFQNTTRTFEAGEGRRAYALMELNGLTLNRAYEAKAYWHSPDGTVVGPTVSRFTPTDANWFVWFWIDLSAQYRRAPGSWSVRLELEDRLLSTRYFSIRGGVPAVRARIETVPEVDRSRIQEAFQGARSRFEVGPNRQVVVLVQVDGVTPQRPYEARIDIHRPDGSVLPAQKNKINFTPTGNRHYFWYSRRLDIQFPGDPGLWKARVYLEGRLLGEKPFEVSGSPYVGPSPTKRPTTPAGGEEFPSE